MNLQGIYGTSQEFTESNPSTGTFYPPNSDVYKSLTPIYGKIHQMSRGEIVANLKRFNLNTCGSRDVLMKRLKNHYKVQKLSPLHMLPEVKLCPFYIVMDFEATCNTVNSPDYPHEIIEFPAVLVSTEKRAVVDHFQSHVRPEINPVLSDFCVGLTGITQEQVDAADTFPVVIKKFEQWMRSHDLGIKYKFVVVTDGPWDMAQFLHGQCKVANVPYPYWARKWLNVRKIFRNYYKIKMCNLKGMLETLGLEFDGRPHCGLDDARNIARILLSLMVEGAPLHINERLDFNQCTAREKALLASATTTVEKRLEENTDQELGELLGRLRIASSQVRSKKKSHPMDSTRPRGNSSTQEEKGEPLVETDESEPEKEEGASGWTNNKYAPLVKPKYKSSFPSSLQ